MKTKNMHIKELIYTILEVGNIPQEDELKRITDEYSLIEDKLYKLLKNNNPKEYLVEISRLISTAKQVESIFKSLLNKQIDTDKCISELMLTLKTSIKLIKGNGKITI